MDPSVVTASIAAARYVVESGRWILELNDKLKNIDLLEKVTELRQAALQLNEANHTLGIENLDLKRRLDEIEKLQITESRLKFEDGRYYLKEPTGGEHAGPFCVKCWHTQKILPPLHGDSPKTHLGSDFWRWRCLVCGSTTMDATNAPDPDPLHRHRPWI